MTKSPELIRYVVSVGRSGTEISVIVHVTVTMAPIHEKSSRIEVVYVTLML